MTRRAQPRLHRDGGTQGRHDGAARGADPAPRDLHVQPQGAEVLDVRRRAAAALAGSRRQALPAGVGLAQGRLRAALRGGARGRRPGREHAVLPVAPRRAAQDRRAPARGQADRGRPRPHRPRLQQLDAPVVRRPRADRRLRGGVRQGARADRQGLGAVLALRPARPVRRAAGAPVQLRRPGAGARAALPHHRRRPARGRRPYLRLPGDHARSGRLHPARQQPQLRRAGTPFGRHRPAAAGRRLGRAVRPATSVAPRQRPAPAAARQRRRDPTQAVGGSPRPAAAVLRRRHRAARADHRRELRRLALHREPRVVPGTTRVGG